MKTGSMASGVWLIVVLTGVGYSFPSKKVPHDDPKASPALRSKDKLLADEFTDEALDFSSRSTQPSGHMGPAPALYSSGTGPVRVGYNGGSLAGSPQSRIQGRSFRDNWSVRPPSPFSDDLSFASEAEASGVHYVNPPGSFHPVLQPGGASYEERTFESGTYNSESEKRGPPRRSFQTRDRLHAGRPLALVSPVGGLVLGYNNYMVLPVPRRVHRSLITMLPRSCTQRW